MRTEQCLACDPVALLGLSVPHRNLSFWPKSLGKLVHAYSALVCEQNGKILCENLIKFPVLSHSEDIFALSTEKKENQGTPNAIKSVYFPFQKSSCSKRRDGVERLG